MLFDPECWFGGGGRGRVGPALLVLAVLALVACRVLSGV